MAGATSSIEGVLTGFQKPILPKIDRELEIEGLVDIHQLISGNVASVASNLGGGRHGHLALMMTDKEYMEQTRFAFVPPQNRGDYPQIMESTQEQALGNEIFRQNQALFQKKKRRGQSLEKVDRRGGGTSLSFPTGGSAHRVRTGVHTYNATASIFQLLVDRRN